MGEDYAPSRFPVTDFDVSLENIEIRAREPRSMVVEVVIVKKPHVGIENLACRAIPCIPCWAERVNAVRTHSARLFMLGVASCCGCLARAAEASIGGRTRNAGA